MPLLSFFRRLSIRTQLLLLVLVVLSLFTAFVAWHVAKDARQAREAAYARVKLTAEAVADRIDLALRDKEEALGIVAAEFRGNPPLRAPRFDPDQFVRNRPQLANLGVRDLHANNIYSHRPNPTPAGAALKFPWVEQGLRSETFAAGDAFLGTLSGRWVTVLTYPVRGEDGRRSGFVNLSVDLAALNERVMTSIPKDAIVPVFDRQDRFLLRSADPAAWIGKPLPAAQAAVVRGMREGYVTVRDVSGMARIYAVVTMPRTGWRVFAGLPEDGVFADYRAALWNSIAVGAVALLLVLALARQISLAILRPIRELAGAADKVAAGNSAARAGVSGPIEIVQVAQQINRMLDALERQREERAALTRHIEQLFRLARDIILLVGPSGDIIEANDAALAAYGYSAEELRRMNIRDLRAPAAQAAIERDWHGARDPEGVLFETVHRRKNGSTFPVEISAQTLDIGGKRYRQSFVRDISERHAADAHIRRQNRAYATLSETNQLIVRLRDESRLYPRICSIAVEFGGYVGAWVGLIDEAKRLVVPVAVEGAITDYVQQLGTSTDPELPEGRGPVALALREGRPYYCNDYASDPATLPWRELAAEFGLRSMAALPLRRGGAIVGALTLYAAEPGAFDPATRALIEEMAADVSFALDNFQREAARERAEQALRQSEEHYRAMLDQNVAAVFAIEDGRLSYANRRAGEILGYAVEELSGRAIFDLIVEADRANVAESMRQLLSGEQESVEQDFGVVHKDGSVVDLGARAIRATVQGRKVVLGMAQDIGERKRAQAEIERYVQRLERAMESTLRAVSGVVELRDPYTAGHEHRVGELAAAIGAEMGLPAAVVKGLRLAGYVHDLGKVSVPAEILSKPTKLTPMEYELIKSHPQSGFEVLKDVDFPWPVAQIILQHHERLDGSGYPRGLKGDEILPEARVIAVADVVEAMSSHRPYRPGMGVDAALAEIETNSGKSYDAQVVAACLRLFRDRGYALPD